MKLPTLLDLLEAGAHFGHETSKWHPRMESLIYTTRNGVHILNLQQTLASLEQATDFLMQKAGKGGIVLFVGTKRQARDIVKKHAERCGMPYVTTRWLGGTLTNFDTILKSITKLNDLRATLEKPESNIRTKKERAVISNEIQRLEEVLEGIKDLRRMPDVVVLIGSHNEKTAHREANRKGVPVVALVDTNADPEGIEYSIPANDDAVRSLELIVGALANAILEGNAKQQEDPDQQIPVKAATEKTSA